MRLLYLFLTFFLFSANVSSQNPTKNPLIRKIDTEKKTYSSQPNKNETQEWIKEKIEGFSRKERHGTKSGNDSIYSNSSIKFEVEFDECNLIIKYYDQYILPGFDNRPIEMNSLYIYKIPVGKLSKPLFVKMNNNNQFFFRINSNENLITKSFNFKSGETNETEKSNESIISFDVPENFLKNNLPERLANAFTNLITLCGGNVPKEVF